MEARENSELNRLASAISQGKIAAVAIDFLSEHLDALAHAADKRVFILMNKGEVIDPNLLVQVYAEKNAYSNIKNTLLQNRKLGQSSGTKFKKIMESQDERQVKNTAGRTTSKFKFSSYRG